IDPHYPALETLDAARQRITSQIFRIETGVEVKGIAENSGAGVIAHGGHGNSAEPRGDTIEGKVFETGGIAQAAQLEPVLMNRDLFGIGTVNTKGMKIAVRRALPVPKLNPQLERGARFAQEIVLVDSKGLIEQTDRRNRRLADTDGA